MKENLYLFVTEKGDLKYAKEIASKLNIPIKEEKSETNFYLKLDEDGLSLAQGDLVYHGDYTKMIRRLNKNNIQSELIVKASKIKGIDRPLKILDATAGLGEDSLLLAAMGYNVSLYESDEVIAMLLKDTIKRAMLIEELKEAVSNMQVFEEDSINAMQNLDYTPDVVVLDPMFPERTKSSLNKKKFQLIHLLEKPCSNENELLDAALKCGAKKIVIKRPLKAEYLAGKKPSYSLEGKAIRYDCIVL